MSEERRRTSDEALSRFEGKLDAIISTQANMHAKQEVIRSKVERIETETIKTNGRVTAVEKWQNTKTGEFRIICWMIAIVAGAVVGAWVKVIFQ